MKYLNQLEYEHIPYRTNVKDGNFGPDGRMRNVRLSGCGLCSVCMAIDLLTDRQLELEECVRISEDCGANWAYGTDMKVLGPVIADKIGLSYSNTSNLEEAIEHLRCGGVIVAHVGVPEGKELGLFTKGGHYIAVIATDGKRVCILDPSYTLEKFSVPERVGRIDISRAPYLYCDAEVLDSETKPGKVKYHLFSRK